MSIFGPGLINKYVPLLLTRLITKFLEAYKSQLQGRWCNVANAEEFDITLKSSVESKSVIDFYDKFK